MVMRTERQALDLIANVMTGEDVGGQFSGVEHPTVDVPNGVVTEIGESTMVDAPAGTYTITITGEWSFDTTRDWANFVFTSTTHTVLTAGVQRRSSDPATPALFTVTKFFVHTGGDIHFKVEGSHSKSQVMTVNWVQVMIDSK